jgi:hypothetical protein
MGDWTTTDIGGGLDRLLLTVTPTAGETMSGFDIAIYDPTFVGGFQTGTLFKAVQDTGSSFLVNKSHTVPGTPPVTVTDLLATVELQDTYVLGGAFVVTGDGAYKLGWSNTLSLAEIIVPHGSITNPLTQLVVAKSDYSGPNAMASRPDGSLMPIQFVPEPGTLALLASGAIGLLVFAWRRRK